MYNDGQSVSDDDLDADADPQTLSGKKSGYGSGGFDNGVVPEVVDDDEVGDGNCDARVSYDSQGMSCDGRRVEESQIEVSVVDDDDLGVYEEVGVKEGAVGSRDLELRHSCSACHMPFFGEDVVVAVGVKGGEVGLRDLGF